MVVDADWERVRRDTRRRARHPDGVRSLWPQMAGHLRLLLGGCLLVLVISGCTPGLQGTMSQDDPVVAAYEQAWASAGSPVEEKRTLLRLCNAYTDRGQPANAIACFTRALDSRMYQPAEKQRLLNRLGVAYSMLSQYDQAIAAFERALALARKMHDRAGEGWALLNLGVVSARLSRYDHAMGYYEQALAMMRAGHDRRGEGMTLNNLGGAYQRLHQYEQAIAFHQQALTIAREVGGSRSGGSWSGEGSALNSLGNAYYHLRQYDQALVFYEQALAFRQAAGHRLEEGQTFNNLGRVYAALERHDQARVYHEQALVVLRQVGHREGEGLACASLMAVWRAKYQPRLAIFYGKQAVNRFQEIREHLQPLAEELQESFHTAKTPIYRELAEILLAEGRLLEAQQVLELLKAEEYSDFIGRRATDDARQGRVVLTPEETAWAARYRAIADRLAALGTEYGALRAKPARTVDETQRLGALETDLAVARQAFEQFLAHLQIEVWQAPQVQERIARLAEESQGLMDALRDLGSGTVALYTLVTDTAYHVILTTPTVQLAREQSMAAADLARKVHAFRQALDPDTRGSVLHDPRPLARELYQILVAPIAQDLRQAQATTLMWSLDGVLRYLPLAALHDGEQYLLERYRLAVFTPASATRLKDQPRSQWSGVSFGVSKAHGDFPALPTVPDELRGIIRDPTQRNSDGVLPGLVQLDEAFTDAALRTALRQRPPVVHIASHFQLHPGDDMASVLLLGDGSHLPLAQLKTWPQPFQGVELLTLSACNTAVGSRGAEGTEVEGFAALAQRQGAKAVVATLWPVVDASTKELMQTFYRLRESQPGLPKVEALRQAQLTLLRGPGQREAATRPESRAGVLVADASRGLGGALPRFRPDPGAPYAHPAFWAPFVLIGNWR
jgi:CHAT domain-containing protein/Tfp pilus assembly protein PilF